jgi:hypothetical protein
VREYEPSVSDVEVCVEGGGGGSVDLEEVEIEVSAFNIFGKNSVIGLVDDTEVPPVLEEFGDFWVSL